ncbi:MAG: hypothetical protein P8184_15555 [Calditrichia bacterium]
MNVYQKRIQLWSRILTLSLAIFIANFLVIKFYMLLWRIIRHSIGNIPGNINVFVMILLPVALSVLTLFIIVLIDKSYFRIRHTGKKNFYLLSWIIFLGMIVFSISPYFQLEFSLSLLAAFSAIFIFKFYRLPADPEGETAL